MLRMMTEVVNRTEPLRKLAGFVTGRAKLFDTTLGFISVIVGGEHRQH